LLNVRPNDLLGHAAKTAPVEQFLGRRPRVWRQVPPSWRTCRLTMSRAHFVGIVAAWVSGLALLIAVVVTVRWS